jgi:hypothetical protein
VDAIKTLFNKNMNGRALENKKFGIGRHFHWLQNIQEHHIYAGIYIRALFFLFFSFYQIISMPTKTKGVTMVWEAKGLKQVRVV